MAKTKQFDAEARAVRIRGDVFRMAKLIDAVTNEGVGQIVADAARQGLAKRLKELNEQGQFVPPRPA